MAEDELEWRCHKRSRYFFSTFFHSSTLTEQEIADELETKVYVAVQEKNAK